MIKSAVFLLMFSCLISLSCLAQEITPEQQLRSFGNKMVGGTWHQKLPDDASNKATYKWALGNQYLIVHLWNEKEPNGLAVVGVDPETKRQTWWVFLDSGEVQITSVDVQTLSPTKDKIELAGELAAGSGFWETVWPDKDRLDILPQTGAVSNGEPAKKETWERASDVEDASWLASSEPAEVGKGMALANYFIGRKWMDGVMAEGQKFVGGGFGRWILNGKFHIFTASTAADDQTAWSHIVIMGMDPKTQKPASWEFTSNGSRSDITYDESGMTIYGKNIRANGDKYTFEGTFTMDGDTLRYKSKIGQDDETPVPYGWNYRDAEE